MEAAWGTGLPGGVGLAAGFMAEGGWWPLAGRAGLADGRAAVLVAMEAAGEDFSGVPGGGRGLASGRGYGRFTKRGSGGRSDAPRAAGGRWAAVAASWRLRRAGAR
ncbi:hypothetical protein BRAS3809_1160015 [Bradyrhizobium sp. STM 3809]|nr:hypothetical protein BRAS3809_1160015 [Bradyrhizobium sp. STM 3809]